MIMFAAAAAAVFVLDLITKLMVSGAMELGSTIEIFPGILDLSYVQNTGAAWGLLSDRQALLQVLTVVLLACLAYYAVKHRKKLSKLELISLGLILGGGLGNFISRLIKGYVVDFLNIQIIPVFNVADIGITVGCFLLVFSTLLAIRNEEADGL